MVKTPQDHLPPATEPFTWTASDGTEITLPPKSVIKAGWMRRNRHREEVDIIFLAIEEHASTEQLAAIDDLSMGDVGDLWNAWMGATPGESGRSST